MKDQEIKYLSTILVLYENLSANQNRTQDEQDNLDMAEYILFQSIKPLLEEVKKLKFARCKNCEWFSREPIEGAGKNSSQKTIEGEKGLLNKGFGRCTNDKVNEQAFFYDDEQVGFDQPGYPGKVDYTGMVIDCSTDECGFLFHETFGCVNFEKREATNEEH